MSAPEFDGQPMTKREVLIARKAFSRGFRMHHDVLKDVRRETPSTLEWWGLDYQEARAAECYPLPKVTRPRVVRDPDLPVHWMVAGGCIVRTNERGVNVNRFMSDRSSDWAPLPRRVALWADLLANPTEEVEA